MVLPASSDITSMLGKFYPCPGDILTEARSWADSAGFAVVTRNSSRSTLYLTCACGGQPRRKKPVTQPEEEVSDKEQARKMSRKRTSIRCGCPFLIGANLRQNGFWEVSKIHSEHNHKLEAHPYVLQLHQKAQNGLSKEKPQAKKASSTTTKNVQEKVSPPIHVSSPPITQTIKPSTPPKKATPISTSPSVPIPQQSSTVDFTTQSKSLLNEILGFLRTDSSELTRQQLFNKIQGTLNTHEYLLHSQPTRSDSINSKIPLSLENNPGSIINIESPPVIPNNFKITQSKEGYQEGVVTSGAQSTVSTGRNNLSMVTPNLEPNHSIAPTIPASLQNTINSNLLKNISQLPLDQGILPFVPKNDGNDGFRALAHGLLKDESQYQHIKSQMFAEVNKQATVYQQLYWFDMPRLVETIQSDGKLFYTHDCPQLAANTFFRPIVVFPFASTPTLFLPLAPPTNPLADIFPIFLGQLPNNNWIHLNVPRTAAITWPPVCPLHHSVCTALNSDTHLTGVWRSFTATPPPRS